MYVFDRAELGRRASLEIGPSLHQPATVDSAGLVSAMDQAEKDLVEMEMMLARKEE